jgi:RNA polymerase sigma-70 factor (ECF subfamily)
MLGASRTNVGESLVALAEDQARKVDALLVQRCRSGDDSAWAAIVDRFSSYVYAIALRHGLTDHQAQDVYQEVFMRAFTHLETLCDEGALKPWIAQLTRRAAVDALRVEVREVPAPDAGQLAAEHLDLDQIEEAIAVQRALDDLPAPFGEALGRFFLMDQSYRTIGEALCVPAGTVASRISRGLSMLRAVLDPDGERPPKPRQRGHELLGLRDGSRGEAAAIVCGRRGRGAAACGCRASHPVRHFSDAR